LAQQPLAPPTPASKSATQPDTGSVSNNIYTNDFFRFFYTFPAGWRVQNVAEQRNIMEEGHKALYGGTPEESEEHQQAMKWTWTLFGAESIAKDEPAGSSLQIVAFDVKGDPTFKDPVAFLAAMAEELKARGAEIVQKPSNSVIAGREFFVLKMKIDDTRQASGRRTIYYATALTVEHGFALAWFCFADNSSTLQDLLGGLNQLKFLSPNGSPFAPHLGAQVEVFHRANYAL
jgi:hypothetical protein